MLAEAESQPEQFFATTGRGFDQRKKGNFIDTFSMHGGLTSKHIQ